MRIVVIIFLTSIFGVSFGQSFSYPTIKQNASSDSGFALNGWTILKSANGDLNNDKHDDIAFVLQLKDSITIISIRNEDDYNDTVVYQPRILVIAFYNPITKRYDKIEQSNSFILCHDNPLMDEPFQDITINKQVLQISFHIWHSIGSWTMSNNIYKFRYKDQELKLIGADYNSVHRGFGETESRSYNFLTKKVKVETGNIFSSKIKTSWRTFNIKELKTLTTFKEPFTYEVEKNFYL